MAASDRPVRRFRPTSYPLTAQVGPHRLADYLAANGIIPVAVNLADEPSVEDDEIELGDNLTVQVGQGYAILNLWVEQDGQEGASHHGHDRFDARDIVADIRLYRKTGRIR